MDVTRSFPGRSLGRRSALVLLGATACGGGSPTRPPDVPVSSVVVTAFYDEDGDSRAEPTEGVRVPGLTVILGGRSAQTQPQTGQALFSGIPAGTYPLRVAGLPPYWQVTPPAVTVPAPGEIPLPLTLPIGGNRPNVYAAFGDSITVGDGSRGGEGFRERLRGKLERAFGRSTVLDRGVGGTQTEDGVRRVGGTLAADRPAFLLLMYGTNNWNELRCKVSPPCTVVDDLRRMVRAARDRQVLPVVATIPPVNEGFDVRAPASRNEWVRFVNGEIKAMAREEGVPVADVEAALRGGGPLRTLFVDHIHPNDAGYELIAQAFFDALSHPAAP